MNLETFWKIAAALEGKRCRICAEPVIYADAVHPYWPSRPMHEACHTHMLEQGATRKANL
jgi:hypothetical protein